MEKIKLCIIGHGRHGKDTVAGMIGKELDYKFKSSSEAASEIFIFNELKDKYNYKTPFECFEDRSNHRTEWYNLICDYNKEDKANLAKDIMKSNDIYVGMRDDNEMIECKRTGVFDIVIGVFDPRKPLESPESFNINMFEVSDFIICNNGDLDELKRKVDLILYGIGYKKDSYIVTILKKFLKFINVR